MDTLGIPRELIPFLPTIPSEALKVFLVLHDRTKQGSKLGLTLTELSRLTNYGTQACADSLGWLADKQLIDINPKGKHYVIRIKDAWGDPTPIPFTYDDTDATKIAKLEAEVRRLDSLLQRGVYSQKSGLADVLQGEERDLVLEIEGKRGYGLSVIEAYLLGKSVQAFNPTRVKETWRRMARQRDPIRAAYAALKRGIKGGGAKPFDSEPFQKVTYREG